MFVRGRIPSHKVSQNHGANIRHTDEYPLTNMVNIPSVDKNPFKHVMANIPSEEFPLKNVGRVFVDGYTLENMRRIFIRG